MLAIAGITITVVWISILARFRELEPPPPPVRADLNPWDFLGCVELEVGDWEPPRADASVRASVPRHLLLVPDAFDEWGRGYETFRALPLSASPPSSSGDAARRPTDGRYRWFTRADTLWVVWSGTDGRGGVALRRPADGTGRVASTQGLAGRAVFTDAAGASAGATARAWPSNCHTGLREAAPGVRR